MKWATIGDDRFEASPELRLAGAKCPCCYASVTAKCGEITTWHWAHQSLDCDPWSEPESEWHREWKGCFPKEWQEAKIGKHRADVKTPRMVIELQNSLISPKTIRERENFYGNMIWVVNAQEFNLNIRKHDDHVSFRWKWPRKSWWESQKPLYFDLGIRGILEVKKIYNDTPCGGWGNLFPNRAEFLKKLRIIQTRGFESVWTNERSVIRDAISGIVPSDNLTDHERLILYAGKDLAEIITRGTCNWKTYRCAGPHWDYTTMIPVGNCGGRLKLFYTRRDRDPYLWCTRCNRSPEYKGDQLPQLHPKIALICQKIISQEWMPLEACKAVRGNQ
jgi:competence protein CoiA